MERSIIISKSLKTLPRDLDSIILKYDYYFYGNLDTVIEGSIKKYPYIDSLSDGRIIDISSIKDNHLRLFHHKTLKHVHLSKSPNKFYATSLTSKKPSLEYCEELKGWRSHIEKIDKVFKYPKDHINVITVLLDDRIITGSENGTLKIFNLLGQCTIEVKAHKSSIENIVLLSNNKIATGSWDHNVKFWNTESLTCEGFMDKHLKPITCILTIPKTYNHQELIISGSNDKLLIVSDINGYLSELKAHRDPVECAAVLDEDRIVSGGMDHLVILWNINTYEKEYIFDNKHRVSHIDILINRNIVINSAINTITIWDPETDKQTNLDAKFFGISYILVLPNGKIAINRNEIIKIYS